MGGFETAEAHEKQCWLAIECQFLKKKALFYFACGVLVVLVPRDAATRCFETDNSTSLLYTKISFPKTTGSYPRTVCRLNFIGLVSNKPL
jgi:hypothetical protein